MLFFKTPRHTAVRRRNAIRRAERLPAGFGLVIVGAAGGE